MQLTVCRHSKKSLCKALVLRSNFRVLGQQSHGMVDRAFLPQGLTVRVGRDPGYGLEQTGVASALKGVGRKVADWPLATPKSREGKPLELAVSVPTLTSGDVWAHPTGLPVRPVLWTKVDRPSRGVSLQGCMPRHDCGCVCSSVSMCEPV